MLSVHLLHLAGHAIGMLYRCRADTALQALVAHELGRGLAIELERVVARRAARLGIASFMRRCRRAAVDQQQFASRADLEREAAGTSVAGQLERGRRAGIDHDHRRAALQAHITRRRNQRVGFGRALVVGQHDGECIALGRAHAVEARELPVSEPEAMQHRCYPLDGSEQRLVGFETARDEALLQRQQVEQQLHQNRRVAARMAAVGEDLPFQFFGEMPFRKVETAFVSGDAQASLRQPDQGQQSRIAVRRVAPGG